MSEREEMEQKIYSLRCVHENLEDRYRQILHKQEEEDEDLQYCYYRLELNWESCGEQDMELGNLLDEERYLLDRFRKNKYELEEELSYEYSKRQNKIDEEVYDLQRQLRYMEEEREKGAKENADN